MAELRTRDGRVEVEVGDDVEFEFDDTTVQGGVRAVMGTVNRVDQGENAVWVRGIRVDLDSASLRAAVRAGRRSS